MKRKKYGVLSEVYYDEEAMTFNDDEEEKQMSPPKTAETKLSQQGVKKPKALIKC